jgi:hypothetical protein
VCLVTVGLMIPSAYLASYPIAYRVLVGSDEDRNSSVPFLRMCCLCEPPTPEAIQRWELWCKLSRYYFPPAEWMTDHTPVQIPVLFMARMVNVGSQLEGEVESRAFHRRIDQALRTGNWAEVDAEFDRAIAESDEKSIAEQSWE